MSEQPAPFAIGPDRKVIKGCMLDHNRRVELRSNDKLLNNLFFVAVRDVSFPCVHLIIDNRFRLYWTHLVLRTWTVDLKPKLTKWHTVI